MKQGKQHKIRYSLIGIAIVLGFLVFVEHSHDHEAIANSDSLSTSPFASWAWSGTPVNQRFNNEGTADEVSVGFIHLNCNSAGANCVPEPEAAGGSYPNVQMHLDAEEPSTFGDVSGWAWIGTSSDATDAAIGWMNFDPEPAVDTFGPCGYPTEPCHDARIDTENREELSGWARLETLACYGEEQTEGGDYCGTTNDYHDNDWGWVKLRGQVDDGTGDEYGLLYRDGHLAGWAWSGGGTLPGRGFANTVGFGWLQFYPGTVVVSDDGYFSTEGGDVYAQQGIANPDAVPASDPNATFLLFGSDNAEFVNFTTELSDDGTFEDYNALTLPEESSNYKSELGQIDFTKLETPVNGNLNIYGDPVRTDNSLSFLYNDGDGDQLKHLLNGEVIVVGDKNNPGSFTLDQALTFVNAQSSPASGLDYNGSGTIIVYGDLTINANTFYDNTQLNDIQNLGSVAWIVHGDVTIGENVSNMVGAFFVLQDDTEGGSFITQPATAQQLRVQGLVMAHEFVLQRTYQGTLNVPEPAELFEYDGRVLLNTPPGVRDYTSTLPRFGQ